MPMTNTSIVIPEVSKTEIFVNSNEQITIRQPGLDDDNLIILSSKAHARAVSRAINQLLKIATFNPQTEDEE